MRVVVVPGMSAQAIAAEGRRRRRCKRIAARASHTWDTRAVDENRCAGLQYRLERVGAATLVRVIGHPRVGGQHDRGERVEVIGNRGGVDAEDAGPGTGLARVVGQVVSESCCVAGRIATRVQAGLSAGDHASAIVRSARAPRELDIARQLLVGQCDVGPERIWARLTGCQEAEAGYAKAAVLASQHKNENSGQNQREHHDDRDQSDGAIASLLLVPHRLERPGGWHRRSAEGSGRGVRQWILSWCADV